MNTDDDATPIQLAQFPELRTKAQWQQLTLAEMAKLSSHDWQQMPRSIFKLTPKKLRQVESAMKKFLKMDVAQTKRSLAIIGLMYRNEKERRIRDGKI
jgi:hypothetical protein